MRIAYVGIDLLYPALPALFEAGCDICEIFTCETDNVTEFNRQIDRFAKQNGIPLTIGKIKREDLCRLKRKGCSLVVCGGYYHRIPVDDTLLMVNIHPSPLPIGRGAWPMPVTILRGLKKSGVSIHKMTEDFDKGDILLQREISIAPNETLQTMVAKQQQLLPEMMQELVENFSSLYQNALAQGEGEYWACPSESDYPILPQMEAAEADLILRAFYGYECIYRADDKSYGLLEGRVHPSSCFESGDLIVKGGIIKSKRVRQL